MGPDSLGCVCRWKTVPQAKKKTTTKQHFLGLMSLLNNIQVRFIRFSNLNTFIVKN